MREYDATEIAFKHGYQKAVDDVFDKLEKEFLCYIADYTGKYHKTFYSIKKQFTND